MSIFDLFRKNRMSFEGYVDYHSHILPGVDDGVQSVDESLAILSEYEKMGIAEVWMTPHIMTEMPNETSLLRMRFDELLSAYNGKLSIHLASENMIDTLFIERLQNNDLLTIGTDKEYLLVETSYYNPPIRLFETLSDIRMHGYIPILAHPERYEYMGESDYVRLHEIGVAFQLNLLSTIGFYGSGAKKKASYLAEMGFYSFSGSDIHYFDMISSLKKVRR